MFLFGKEVKDFKSLVDVTAEEMSTDGYWVDECTGRLPKIEDICDLHDILEDWVDEEDYEEFEKILDEGEKSFDGIEFDEGDSMYHMSGGGFSSWSDYYSYRFG